MFYLRKKSALLYNPTYMISKKQIAGIVIIALGMILGFSLVGKNKSTNPAENTQSSLRTDKIISASMQVGADVVQLKTKEGTTLYEALVQAQSEGKVMFVGQNNPSLGFFITDIGLLHTGNGKYLLYYINGEQAAAGISAYILKDGDVIDWKLE